MSTHIPGLMSHPDPPFSLPGLGTQFSPPKESPDTPPPPSESSPEPSSSTEKPSSPPEAKPEPRHHGFTRFELELEFVTLLSSPLYLNHLASLKLLQSPPFIAYLSYLRYWTRPEYIRFLSYPGPTLRALQLLQEERFRAEILSPEVVARMMKEGVEASMAR